jgi:hypothetical protein
VTGTRVPVLLALLAAGCSRPAATVADADVYGRLVDCGALRQYDGGAAEIRDGIDSVAAAHREKEFPWLECVYAGGSLATCGAPCP